MYLTSYSYPSQPSTSSDELAISSDETSSSATVLILLSRCVSLNFFFWIPFLFLETFPLINSISLSFEPWTVKSSLSIITKINSLVWSCCPDYLYESLFTISISDMRLPQMTKFSEGKGYKGIRTIKIFEFENTENYVKKFCYP